MPWRNDVPGRERAVVPDARVTWANGATLRGETTDHEHQYRFRVDDPGEHVVQTSGGTDLVMALYGPDDDTAKVAEDDDSGSGRNPRITSHLGSGKYLVQPRHFHRTNGVGDYALEVVRRRLT